MSGVGCLVLATLALQSPSSDSLRVLALRLPEPALIAELRARPLPVRDAIADALRQSVRGSPAIREEAMTAARSLAQGYAVAWQDSFLVRQVSLFAAWSPEHRQGKLWVDSLRRAGIAAYGREGPGAAIPIWRRALSRATTIGDTAAIAALLGNIGAAHLALGRLDSAESRLIRADALAAAIGDLRVEANAVGALAGLSQDRGDLAAAHQGYIRALALRERIGDTRGIAADRNNLGLLAQEGGDLDAARRHFESALALNRADGRDEVAATNLVNLAGLASLAGEFAQAETLYRQALATWRARELWGDAASALHGLGELELRRGDYPAAQAALRQALAIYQRTGQVSERLAVQRALAGSLSGAGELQGALDQLRQAERIAASARAPAEDRAGVALDRADVDVQLNDLPAAERLYRQAEALYRQARAPGGQADAQQGLAALLLDRQDTAGAEMLLAAALRAQQTSGDQRSAALTRIQLGKLAAQRGDTTKARRLLARAEADLERRKDPVAAAAALGERAGLEASAGLPAVAAALYRSGLDRLGDRVAPEVAWQLHAGLGRAWEARGSMDEAARELRTALAAIDPATRSLTWPERRSGFLADKWAVYADLARIEYARGRPGAAFELSESLRAREMLALLDRGRIASDSRVPADLVAREQDLRHQIAELSSNGPEPRSILLRGPDRPPSGAATREALLQAQQAYGDLLGEIRERAPRHADLVASEPAQWQDVSRQLRPDEALIEYLVSDSGTLAFVVTSDTLSVVDLGIRRPELAQLVRFVRGVLESPPRGEVDSLWRAPLRRLHRQLIDPVEATGLLHGKQRLVLVPHAELHYLPFAALLEDSVQDRFLIQRYDLAEAPSASVWLGLGQRRTEPAPGGVLAFAPRADGLPGSRHEVEAIARLEGASAQIRIGAAATEEAFRREAPTHRVLHLATYGVLNKQNPLFSFVELAPGGGQDGRLEVHEIFGLTLAADLVVLSACQTGVGSGSLADVPAGDDWVGLTRAFLHAGAARVVATLWPVEDWPTASLMERLYGEYETGRDPVHALAVAQRAALGAPATSHPFAWAGFIIVGNAAREDHGHDQS
jgi:CHAT domain-containing protein